MAKVFTTITVASDCGHPHKVGVITRAQLQRLVRVGTVVCGARACQEAWAAADDGLRAMAAYNATLPGGGRLFDPESAPWLHFNTGMAS